MARPKSDIEPRIIRAAHDIFLEQGVDSASLRAIARSAGTNIGMVYYYFATKDDLFMAVVEDAYDGVLGRFERALDAEATVEERLLRVYTLVGSLSVHELEVARIVLREMMSSTERRARLLERFQRGHLPLIVNTIEDGFRTGRIDDALPFPVVMLCALAVGAAPQILLRVLGDNLPGVASAPKGDELAALLVRIFFQGVGSKHRPGWPTPVPHDGE